MKPLKFVLLFSLFLISNVGLSEDSARALYDQGKYQEALEVIKKNGLNSASDYYNAGNCLYRSGKIGQALAYFQKARALAPQSDDIQYNLSLSEETLSKTGALLKDKSLWSGRLAPFLRQIPEEFFDLLLALTTMAFAWLCYRAKKRSLRFSQALTQPALLATLGIWAITCSITGTAVLAHRTKLAAVIADSGVARSGPNETFTELLKLPPGTTVQLTGESRDGWQQIRFSLGNVGWIMEKDLLTL